MYPFLVRCKHGESKIRVLEFLTQSWLPLLYFYSAFPQKKYSNGNFWIRDFFTLCFGPSYHPLTSNCVSVGLEMLLSISV